MSVELIVVGLAALAALAYLVWKLAGGSRGGCSTCPYREGCDTVGDGGCPGVPPGFDHSTPEDEGTLGK